MKTFLLLLTLIAASTLHAQTATLTFPNLGGDGGREENIQVLAGETLQVLAFITQNNGVLFKVNEVVFSTFSHEETAKLFQGTTFAGPLIVSVVVPTAAQLVFTYRKTVVASVATQNVPTQTVNIPENTVAPADLILETSTDLTTWIAALPGSYTPSPDKRFFRVRTVLH
jgi:hypothetical protein